ncbi:Arm DNA-binding domain-containing protein [Vibrio harveyi]|uniref:Arm DNA-binding domain-containing protein n=1 Tax=Vibrio harveyi TaxID=669 RepID=UPI0035C68DF3
MYKRVYKVRVSLCCQIQKLKSHFRKPQSKQLVLSDRDGLYARISKVGGISFFIRYRYAGKQEQLTIGTYPEISLKDARDKNLTLPRNNH